MGGKEGGPGRGEVGGEVAVSGDEEECGGVEKSQRNHPFHVVEAEGGYFAGRVETGEKVDAGDCDDPRNGPPVSGVFVAMG